MDLAAFYSGAEPTILFVGTMQLFNRGIRSTFHYPLAA
jgi:hypothetical protein